MPHKATALRPSQLSQEFVQDSSDESNESDNESEPGSDNAEESSSEESLYANPTTNGVNRDTNASPEDDGESSESDEDEDDTGSTGRQTPIVNGNGKRPLEQEDGGFTDPASKQAKMSQPEDAPQRPQPTTIEAKPFNPPSGFKPLVLDASDYASEAANMFQDLTGKQIWHIAAPAALNIQNIEQFNITSALKGEPIFSDGRVSITMEPLSEINASILVSESRDAVYGGVGAHVARAYQLQINEQGEKSSTASSRVAGSTANIDAVFTATALGESNLPRQQPVGLKSRYTPFGVTQARHLTTTSGEHGRLTGTVNGRSTSTKISRTPSKPTDVTQSNPVGTEEPTSSPKASLDILQKSAEPSSANSTPTAIPGEKKKKKKKRSKLVDTPGI